MGVTLDPGLRLHVYTKSIKDRTVRRLNIIRSIGGKNWGASSYLRLLTYKSLVRPIIDYVPFAPLIMAKTNQVTLERIQKKAIRYSFNKSIDTNSSELYSISKLDSILTRSHLLTDKYISISNKSNDLIKEEIKTYNQAQAIDEGVFCKKTARTTIFGSLKNKKNLSCHKLF